MSYYSSYEEKDGFVLIAGPFRNQPSEKKIIAGMIRDFQRAGTKFRLTTRGGGKSIYLWRDVVGFVRGDDMHTGKTPTPRRKHGDKRPPYPPGPVVLRRTPEGIKPARHAQ